MYQTAATYLAISTVGVSLSFLAASVWKDKAVGSLLRDYLVSGHKSGLRQGKKEALLEQVERCGYGLNSRRLPAAAHSALRPDLPADGRVFQGYISGGSFCGHHGQYGSSSQNENQSPNIVVIMNEAFSDLRILGDFETDAPVLPFWDSLAGNVVRGWANVSVLGGNTANSQYEFLTSDTTGVFEGLF